MPKVGFESEGPPSIVPSESLFDRSETESGVYTKLSASLIRRDDEAPLADRWEEKEEVKPKGIRSGNSGRGPTRWSERDGKRRSCPRGEESKGGEEGEGVEGGGGDGRRSCMQIPSVHLRGILAGSVED